MHFLKSLGRGVWVPAFAGTTPFRIAIAVALQTACSPEHGHFIVGRKFAAQGLLKPFKHRRAVLIGNSEQRGGTGAIFISF